MRKSPLERFEEKYCPEPNTGCWIWTGERSPYGYGLLSLKTEKNKYKSIKAHRFSYETYKGKIPPNYLVCHKCDNPPCVNPEHLFIGTYLDNNRDKIKKNRHNMPKGSAHNRAILTENDVLKIRSEYKKTYGFCSKMAKIYCVDRDTIWNVVNNRTWKHIL